MFHHWTGKKERKKEVFRVLQQATSCQCDVFLIPRQRLSFICSRLSLLLLLLLHTPNTNYRVLSYSTRVASVLAATSADINCIIRRPLCCCCRRYCPTRAHLIFNRIGSCDKCVSAAAALTFYRSTENRCQNQTKRRRRPQHLSVCRQKKRIHSYRLASSVYSASKMSLQQ